VGRSPPHQLEQRQLNRSGERKPPTAADWGQTPTNRSGKTSRQENQTANARTQGEGKGSPGARARPREATRGRRRRHKPRRARRARKGNPQPTRDSHRANAGNRTSSKSTATGETDLSNREHANARAKGTNPSIDPTGAANRDRHGIGNRRDRRRVDYSQLRRDTQAIYRIGETATL
jgi:hypothetical protein